MRIKMKRRTFSGASLRVVEMGGVEPPSKIGELRASTRVVSRLL
jgi:hypothetical protein